MIHQGETLRSILKRKNIKLTDFTAKMRWRGNRYVHQFLAKRKYSPEQIDKICEIAGEDVRQELVQYSEQVNSTALMVKESAAPYNHYEVLISSKDETIATQKELIKDKEKLIRQYEEVIEGYRKSREKMDVEGAIKSIHKQFPLMMQKIELVQQQVASLKV